MRDFLLKHGAYRDWNEFIRGAFPFACETLNGNLLYLDEDFQREVFRGYLDENELTEDNIIDFLSGGDFEPEDECLNLEEDLDGLGVSLKDGELVFDPDVNGKAFVEAAENAGYGMEYENCVYYYNRERDE